MLVCSLPPAPPRPGYAISITQHRELRKAIVFQKAVTRSICDFVSRMVYTKECHKKEEKLLRTAIVSVLNLRTPFSWSWL